MRVRKIMRATWCLERSVQVIIVLIIIVIITLLMMDTVRRYDHDAGDSAGNEESRVQSV